MIKEYLEMNSHFFRFLKPHYNKYNIPQKSRYDYYKPHDLRIMVSPAITGILSRVIFQVPTV
ncbi:hypothetical protein [Methanobrevibacter sp.]|uniref:hypothetical protein n=1 Tax=Methanobrevibacter sp. TaxID=66852 RepID=UPI0026DF543F|nr:hypothetical protein [Methanobrevibacter sp.]MDO5860278.1 hypothetical protein [Methanobrevibacter sp.]